MEPYCLEAMFTASGQGGGRGRLGLFTCDVTGAILSGNPPAKVDGLLLTRINHFNAA